MPWAFLTTQPLKPTLHMTEADFQGITRGGRLCNAEGGLGYREFELVMREQVGQVRLYTLQARL